MRFCLAMTGMGKWVECVLTGRGAGVTVIHGQKERETEAGHQEEKLAARTSILFLLRWRLSCLYR